jgi:hypothetical protein
MRSTRSERWRVGAILLASVLVSLWSCTGGGGEGEPRDGDGAGLDAAADSATDLPVDLVVDPADADLPLDDTGGTTSPGLVEVSDRMVVDERGGLLAIADRSSPLFGTQVLIPVGALSEPTLLSIRQGSPRSGDSAGFPRTMGVGPIVEVLPADLRFYADGAAPLAGPVTVWLPLPAGTSAAGLAVSRRDGDAWVDVASDGARVVTAGPTDGAAGVGLRVTLEVRRFGALRFTYSGARQTFVRNDMAGALTVSLTVHDYQTRDRWGYTPQPLAPEEFHGVRVGSRESVSLELVPGSYLVEGVSDIGARYCAELFVPAEASPLPVTFFAAMATCHQPEVSLTASADRVAPGAVVALEATLRDSASPNASGHWHATGGALEAPGATWRPSGEPRAATWTAPHQPGTYWVWLVAQAGGEMHQGVVTIEVARDNFGEALVLVTDAETRRAYIGHREGGLVSALALPPP